MEVGIPGVNRLQTIVYIIKNRLMLLYFIFHFSLSWVLMYADCRCSGNGIAKLALFFIG